MGEMSSEELCHMFSSRELSKGWKFKQTDGSEDWLPVKKVPSTVHQDLVDNDR